jgi:hypothetical protein
VCTVQAWLGHESLATTQKYPEPSKETQEQLDKMKLPLLVVMSNELQTGSERGPKKPEIAQRNQS